MAELRCTLAILGALVVSVSGCSSRDNQPLSDDGGVKRRVFNPPPSRVRAMPPHNIHTDGIGPYQLRAPLKDILSTLPHGPRIELFRLGTLADFSLVRSEGGALLVGIERGEGVTFVASVDEKIARTETGVGVGSQMKLAASELGGEMFETSVIRDPRLHRYQSLPGVLFVSDGTRGAQKGRVGAVIVDGRAATLPGDDDEVGDVPLISCKVDDETSSRVRDAARLGDTAQVAYACTDGEPVLAVASLRDRVVWLLLDKEKVRRGGVLNFVGLRFAAPLALETDRFVIAVASEERSAGELGIQIDVLRVDGQRLAASASSRAYTVSKEAVTWVGGALGGIEVPVEIAATGPSELVVRGFYVERRGGRAVMVAPLASHTVKLSSTKRKTAASADSGPDGADAGPNVIDAGARRNRPPVGPR